MQSCPVCLATPVRYVSRHLSGMSREIGGRGGVGEGSGRSRGGGIRTPGLLLPKQVRYRCATPRRDREPYAFFLTVSGIAARPRRLAGL